MPEETEESKFVTAAQHQVDVLVKQARMNRVHIRVLYVVVALVLIAGGVLTGVVIDQHSTDVSLRNSGIMSCQSGNSYREGATEVWDKLFAISYGAYPPSAEERKLDDEFLSYVNKIDQVRNCARLYSGHG